MDEQKANWSTAGTGSTMTHPSYAVKEGKPKQVLEACGKVEFAQENTAKLLEELEQQLQGVLRGSDPVAGEQMNADKIPMTPLASQIHGYASRAERLNEKLRSIINRLEV